MDVSAWESFCPSTETSPCLCFLSYDTELAVLMPTRVALITNHQVINNQVTTCIQTCFLAETKLRKWFFFLITPLDLLFATPYARYSFQLWSPSPTSSSHNGIYKKKKPGASIFGRHSTLLKAMGASSRQVGHSGTLFSLHRLTAWSRE